jgi:hypothetical protein
MDDLAFLSNGPPNVPGSNKLLQKGNLVMSQKQGSTEQM